METAGQQGLILKIAAGVFLGVMAAIVVAKTPGWLQQRRQEQDEADKVTRELRLREMKPEEFPARCGKLVKDETHLDVPAPYRVVTVELTTWNGKQEQVEAEFSNFAPKGQVPEWSLDHFSSFFLTSEDDIRGIEQLFPCTVRQ